ncbi:Mpp10 protein [Cylindrobasidium torrendii FP15055 ss-10]|uniref:U3 small nucleolar ribonucleoprotein protein MPP10 n=1 Tax=Cylindrobasidium torrendii FP15055 ss-10 TaxID=1314674 RepID=A0A0D7BLZ9_9AGAR|nr:Mpp10 protein [Cylindrobasidium torrendii FP15055 ss-10]
MASTTIESGPPAVLQSLSTLVDESPQSYIRGGEDVNRAALAAASYLFDLSVRAETPSLRPVNMLLMALSPGMAPATRSQSLKRKRSPELSHPQFNATPLAHLFTEGMDDEQIWAQLDIKSKHLGDILDRALDAHNPMDDEVEMSGGLEEDEDSNEDDPELSGFDMDDIDALEDSEEDEDDDSEEDSEEDAEENESSDDEPHEESFTNLRDHIEEKSGPLSARRKRKGKQGSEVDDDFFDLKEFNALTEAAEAKSSSNGRLGGDDEDSDEESVDLFAAVDDDAFEEADLDEGSKELFYKDFFSAPRRTGGPPPKPGPSPKKGGVRFHDEVRVKKIKARGKNLPVATMYAGGGDDDDEDEDDLPAFEDGWEDEEDEDEMGEEDDFDEAEEDEELDEGSDASGDDGSEQSIDETMDHFKDDLFADDEAEEDADNMTTHEKRMAALKEQITALEEENVGKKDWTLLGEATSRSRPQNSLLEEDLEFERVMKAAPIITEEVVKGLEDRIKARILDNNFDDVVRKRAVEDKPFLPSRVFELKDTKSTQSLAQIYEDEYVATQSGGTTDDRDGKLVKEHKEIDHLWENICYKLDALCNAHFTPKAPKATISSVSNVSSVSFESALPTAQSSASMLAPEEVHKPEAADLKSRSEMTPEEKRALHNKTKKANKKRKEQLNGAVDKYAKPKGSVKQQKEDALKSVVKNGKGVTVVGKQKKDILDKGKGKQEGAKAGKA